MSDAAERQGSHETPVQPPDEPQETREPEPTGEEPRTEEQPPETPAEPQPPPEPPEPLPQAEPGIYRCKGEIAGEHAILGVLTQGQEYDYRQVRDPRVLQAVAAYVELGVLEPVEGSAPAGEEDAQRAEETQEPAP